MLALAIHAQEGDKITGASVRVQAGRATGKVRGSGVERGYEAMEAAIPGNGKNRWMRTPWGGVLWLEPMQGWQEQSRKGRRMRQRGRKPTHDEQVRAVLSAIAMGVYVVVTGALQAPWTTVVGMICGAGLAWATLLAGETWHRVHAPGTSLGSEGVGRTWAILMVAGGVWTYLLLWNAAPEVHVARLREWAENAPWDGNAGAQWAWGTRMLDAGRWVYTAGMAVTVATVLFMERGWTTGPCVAAGIATVGGTAMAAGQVLRIVAH